MGSSVKNESAKSHRPITGLLTKTDHGCEPASGRLERVPETLHCPKRDESCQLVTVQDPARQNGCCPASPETTSASSMSTPREGAAMRFFRRTIQFIVDCFEALTEDDTAAERRAHEARLAQQRWHEFLSR